MQNVKFSHLLVISLTLFSMFFGAGNFIFPPFLGSLAGSVTPVAITAFCLTGVIFPILGIAAVAKSNGLHNLASRVSYKFALVFSIALLLIIGPIFAIPRAANMPYELAIKPFLNEPNFVPLFVYSIIYFIINWSLSINPTKMIATLGKILTPILLVLIVILFTVAIINPMHIDPQTGKTLELLAPKAGSGYDTHAISKGIIEGYQTMDVLASLSFGLVILLTFRRLGIKNEQKIVSSTIKAGVVAGLILMAIYMALAYIGASSAFILSEPKNGAEILSVATNHLFGKYGIIIFGVSIFLACLTTTVGLTCAISEYFITITKIKYKHWIIIWSIISSLFANIGLTAIINYAVPFLGIIYPLALTLIVLAFLDGFLDGDKLTYSLTIYIVLAISFIATISRSFGLDIPFITKAFSLLPFYDDGFEWVLPAIITIIVGSAILLKKRKLEIEHR